MTADKKLDALLDVALQALLSMTPDAIEAAELDLRERQPSPDPLNAETIRSVRYGHAAAMQAAQLWRGCVPQTGYGPEAAAEHPIGSGLSVTG